MLKFAFGFTSGLVVGATGAVMIAIMGLIALEDSPEVLDYLRHKTEQ